MHKPFAWFRTLPTGVVLVAGENPPYGEVWIPLYKQQPEHPDTMRLMHVCDGFDGLHDMDFHEEAARFAFLFGRDEPNREDYLAAYRKVIDASDQVAKLVRAQAVSGTKPQQAATGTPSQDVRSTGGGH